MIKSINNRYTFVLALGVFSSVLVLFNIEVLRIIVSMLYILLGFSVNIQKIRKADKRRLMLFNFIIILIVQSLMGSFTDKLMLLITQIIYYNSCTILGLFFSFKSNFIKIGVAVLCVLLHLAYLNIDNSLDEVYKLRDNIIEQYSKQLDSLQIDNVKFYNSDSLIVKIPQLQSDTTLFFFWNYDELSKKELLKAERLYKHIQNLGTLKFYAVYCYDSKDKFKNGVEDYKTGFTYIERNNIFIPLLATPIDKTLLINLELYRIPELIIIGNNSQIIYRGKVSDAIKHLKRVSL